MKMKMKMKMKTRSRWTLAAATGVSLVLANTSTNAAVIVAANFGGGGSALNGTSADTFAAGITTAGGSGTWSAGAAFLDNGTVNVDGDQNAAYLNLGTYINDAKGTATGLFDLTMNISETVGAWISFGFGVENTPSTTRNFTNTVGTGGTTTGVATIIRRSAGDADAFAGPVTAVSIAGPVPTGTRTLTVSLDFTPAGGWNGTTNHGTVSFSDSVSGPFGSHTYTADNSFGSILISEANASGGTVSSLSLSQIPEPTTTALLGLGGLALLRRRRR
jgi:hypothetical protein